ncbi:MAG: O-antigen ligase family protein [Clostridia bacterium]|nr:O-antigen ligase family protein [Clostridia bacterium]
MKDEKKEWSIIFLGLCLFIIMSLFNTSRWGATFSWVALPSFLIILGCFFENKIFINSKVFLIFALWLVYLLSTALSNTVDLESSSVTFFLFAIVYVVAVSHRYSLKELKILINIYIIVALLGAVNIIYNYWSGDFYAAWSKRATFEFMGVYRDPNYVMAFIVPGISFVFMKLLKANSIFKRVVFLALLVLFFFSIIATGSRTALAVAFGALFVFFCFDRGMTLKKKFLVLSGILLGIAIVFFVMIQILPRSALDRFLNMGQDPRWEIWDAALKVFFDNPMLGGGMGATSQITQIEANYHSHNVYLDILGDSGLIGTMTFILFIATNCCRTTKRNSCFIITCLFVFMAPMFTINGFNTATFYLPLILMTIFSDFCRKEENDIRDIL